MKIIAVDDEKLAVENIMAQLRRLELGSEIEGFTKVEEAFEYLAQNQVDIAFLDIELGPYSGIDLAKKCKELCPRVNIVFVTGHSAYTLDALKLHVSGYLMKPVRAWDLQEEINNLRYPINKTGAKRIRIQTFGHFEVFVDENPIKFPRKKCRECLAYLVDRKGARILYSELSTVLWEERPFDRMVQNNAHKVVSDMMKSLKEVGAEEMVIKSRMDIAINPAVVICDYFAALNGDQEQRDMFTGEYMSNYSWAEYTLAELEHIFHKKKKEK